MKILLTNDDGIFAQGLWELAKQLSSIAEVAVAAPDREQSATGTAVTLRQPLRAHKMSPIVPGIEAYAVEGTPADSVILALDKLVKGKIDLVVSGINHGANLGEDVLISGTVGAALQGYLHGLPALAISIDFGDNLYLDSAASVTASLVKKIEANALPANTFLNVNVPNLPLAEIKGVKVTRLASASHADTVEESHDGRRKYYWVIRRGIGKDADKKTDIWAIEQGNISITPLYTSLLNKTSLPILNSLCSDLLRELR